MHYESPTAISPIRWWQPVSPFMHQWPATLHTHLTKHRDTVASPYKKHSSWAIIYIFFFPWPISWLVYQVCRTAYIYIFTLFIPPYPNISNPTYSILIQFDIKTESRIKERFAPVRHNMDLVKLSALIWETFDGFCVFPENHSGLDTVASLLHVRGSVRLRYHFTKYQTDTFTPSEKTLPNR